MRRSNYRGNAIIRLVVKQEGNVPLGPRAVWPLPHGGQSNVPYDECQGALDEHVPHEDYKECVQPPVTVVGTRYTYLLHINNHKIP